MWNPGSIVFLYHEGMRLLFPREEMTSRQNRGTRGMTLMVLSAQEVAFGTKGPTFSYLFLGNGRLFTVRVDYRTTAYFFLIKET